MSDQMSSDPAPETGKKARAPFTLKKKLLIGGAVLLVLIIIGFNIYRIRNKDVVQVAAARVTEKHLVENVPASGNVVAEDKETIYSEVSGTVEDIRVHMGDKVRAGQILMDLNIPNAEQKLAEARASLASAESTLYQARSGGKTSDLVAAESILEQAESTYKRDKDTLERKQSLLEAGAVSQSELDQAQSDYDGSKAAYEKARADLQRCQEAAPVYLESLAAGVESARAQLQTVERQNAQQGLLCTRDGQVLSISVKAGDQIRENDVLLTIGFLNNLTIHADVPESEAGKIKPGQKVAISGNAFQDEKYPGRITQVGLEVVNKTKKNEDEDTFLPVIVEVKNAPRLLPGYNVDLEITTADIQARVVPIEALVEKDEGDSVYIIKNGVARLTPVKTGISDGITMQIKNGVAKDDQVVLNPSAQLHDGSKVRVQ